MGQIFSDEKRLKQVIFNLMGNAVKFTMSGGILLRARLDGEKAFVEVHDTGIGIKEEDMGTLFKFFGQVSSSKKINQSGMGLGLTISKMIV